MLKYILMFSVFVLLAKDFKVKGIALLLLISYWVEVCIGYIFVKEYLLWLLTDFQLLVDVITFYFVISLLSEPLHKLLVFCACIVYTLASFFFSYPYLFPTLFPFLEYGYFLFFECTVIVLLWIERKKSVRYTIMCSLIMFAYISPYIQMV